MIERFRAAGGERREAFGQVRVRWASSKEEATRTALERWPNAVVGGNLPWELPLPSQMCEASEWASEDDVAERIVCGPDPERHVAAIEARSPPGRGTPGPEGDPSRGRG